MEDLIIKATKTLPEIDFKTDGSFKVSGKVIDDHLQDFFQPIFQWLKNVAIKRICLEIDLEYLNTSGTFHLVEMIRRIEANQKINAIEVIWYYDEDDEDHLEYGKLVEESFKRAIMRFREKKSDFSSEEKY